MIEQILEAQRASSFDVTQHVSPNDPQSRVAEGQLDHYRLMWAIAAVLKPRSILEVGVRFGYSALAFLDAAPTASFVGIDLEPESADRRDALDWARRQLRPFRADLLFDTRSMPVLTEEIFDLVHLVGRADVDELYRDLERAVRQARWVLLDGYFQTPSSLQSVSAFLHRYRRLIEHYLVIPGGGGELLLRVDDETRPAASSPEAARDSQSVRDAYTTEYFLTDCAGYESFTRTGGKVMDDYRLLQVAGICSARSPRRVLDIGCGRGELARLFAAAGADVVAIDYSQPAIDIAQMSLDDEPELASRILFLCADANSAQVEGPFDVVVASDVVEHLAPNELAHLYTRIANLLTPDGWLVVHTFPNRLYYERHYPRLRLAAAQLGAYLPPEPRTDYELVMHINEQDPDTLQTNLEQAFEHVAVWVASFNDPGFGLRQELSPAEIEASRDIFAIASQDKIDLDAVVSHLVTPPLERNDAQSIRLDLLDIASHVRPDESIVALAQLHNGSRRSLTNSKPAPVNISYHLYEPDGTCHVHDGARTEILPWLAPGQSGLFGVRIDTPSVSGDYLLRVALVQEGVAWLDEPGLPCVAERKITVD